MTPSPAPLPLLGTWKLTKCESSRPDLPHPTSGITTFTQEGNAVHYTNQGAWSDGRKTDVNAHLLLDGSWCPVTGSLLSDSLSFQRLPDGSFEARMKKGGADVGSARVVISPDGRAQTGHWEMAGPGGTTIVWKTTSERQ
jgi:hypothetical protein